MGIFVNYFMLFTNFSIFVFDLLYNLYCYYFCLLQDKGGNNIAIFWISFKTFIWQNC